MSRRATRRDREHAYQGQGVGQGGSSATLFEQVLALSAGRPFFTADNYVEVSGKAVAFIDWNDPAHVLSQPASANQVATPAPHSDFGGAVCASFTAAQAYLSSRPVAQWVMDHDGVSTEKWDVLSPLDASGTGLISTTRNAGPGTQTYYTAGQFYHYLSGAAGVVGPVNFGPPIVAGTPTYVDVRHQAADPGAQYRLFHNGVEALAGNYASAPDPGPADTPLSLGAVAPLGYPARMRWVATFFTPALTAEQRAVVHAWIQEYTHIGAPVTFDEILMMAQGRPVFTADNYIEVGGKVVGFVDWNDPTHVMMQASGARQVATPVSHPGFGGALCATFTGAQGYQSNRAPASWVFASDGVSMEYVNVYARTAVTAGVNESLGATVNAGGFCGTLISLQETATWHYWTRSFGSTIIFQQYPGGTAVANEPLYTSLRTETAATPQWVLRKNGQPPNQGAYDAAPDSATPQQSLTLGCQEFTGLTNAAKATWAATLFMPALTPYQRSRVDQWVLNTYGIAA